MTFLWLSDTVWFDCFLTLTFGIDSLTSFLDCFKFGKQASLQWKISITSALRITKASTVCRVVCRFVCWAGHLLATSRSSTASPDSWRHLKARLPTRQRRSSILYKTCVVTPTSPLKISPTTCVQIEDFHLLCWLFVTILPSGWAPCVAWAPRLLAVILHGLGYVSDPPWPWQVTSPRQRQWWASETKGIK